MIELFYHKSSFFFFFFFSLFSAQHHKYEVWYILTVYFMNEKHWDLINFLIICLFLFFNWIIQLSKKGKPCHNSEHLHFCWNAISGLQKLDLCNISCIQVQMQKPKTKKNWRLRAISFFSCCTITNYILIFLLQLH